MKQKLLILGLILGGFCFSLSLTLPMTVAPKIAAQYGEETVDWMINLYSLAVLILSPIFTLLFIKLDYKKMILINLGFASICNFLTAFVSSAQIICFSRLVIGIFQGSFIAAAGFLASSFLGQSKKGLAMSLPIIGFAAAPAVGTPILTQISAMTNWRDSFVILSVLTFGVFLLVLALASPTMPKKFVSVKGELTALTNGRFWLISLIILSVFGAFYAVYVNAATVLIQSYSFSDLSVAVALAVIGVAMYLGAQIGGILADKDAKKPLLIIAFSLLIIFAISFPLENFADVFVGIAFLTAAFCQISIPILQVRLVETVPKSSLLTIVLSQGIICASVFIANFAIEMINTNFLANTTLEFSNYTVGGVFAILSLIFILGFIQTTNKKRLSNS
ncbi:MAG: MFS transporter [Bifidobacteriaceae bacterium]|jgi:predicted MFS family arabinose efflux permease|nr:MFS transporter [Bifidobacteriaceae bacterium]